MSDELKYLCLFPRLNNLILFYLRHEFQSFLDPLHSGEVIIGNVLVMRVGIDRNNVQISLKPAYDKIQIREFPSMINSAQFELIAQSMSILFSAKK